VLYLDHLSNLYCIIRC